MIGLGLPKVPLKCRKCEKYFCQKCIEDWIKMNKKCPHC